MNKIRRFQLLKLLVIKWSLILNVFWGSIMNNGKYSRIKKRNHNPDRKAEPETKGFNFWDTGLLIGITTVLGYFIAYAYKLGYWRYYGVTQDFLKQISIVNILIAMSVIGLSIGALIIYYQGMKNSLGYSKNSVYRKVLTKVFLPRIFVYFGALMLVPKNIFEFKLIHLLYLVLGLLIICYFMPFISEYQTKGYENKLSKHLEKQATEGFTFENIILKYKLYPSAKFIYSSIILLACFGISFVWGYKKAVDKENYLIFESAGENYLVLDGDGDNFIIAPVNLKQKKINKTFQVIEITSEINRPIVFQNVKIQGGIKVQKECTY